MASTSPVAPVAGRKRSAGRPPKDATSTKKAKYSSPDPVSKATPAQSPTGNVQTSDIPTPKLPSKVSDSRPLPSLLEPQPPRVSEGEYQSIATSAVLAASFERSRQRWMLNGIFERVWTKPASKSAIQPGNVDMKNYNATGQCRIRIEPHMFEVETWVGKAAALRKPAMPLATQNGFQQHRGPQLAGQSHLTPPYQQMQGRPIQPVFQSSPHAPQAQSTMQNRASPAASQVPSASQKGPPQQQAAVPDGRPSPDPVISMLATRASSDPELKSLMKEVATGKATPEQLKVFQKHIDDLTKVVDQKKKDEEEARLAKEEQSRQQYLQQQQRQQQQQQQSKMYSTQQNYVPPQLPAKPPVIFQFIAPGSTDDRFQFPRYSILEFLSAQHCLASFIVTRKGCDAVDKTGLEADTEYWQPVTLLVECAYGRTQPIENIQKWVKPADEVRKHIEDVMARCTRAPEAYLAMRLPIKGSVAAECEDVSKDVTPAADDKSKPRAKSGLLNVKFVKPAQSALKKQAATAGKDSPKRQSLDNQRQAAAHSAPPTPAQVEGATAPTSTDGADDNSAPNGNGRPKRAVRKSVRISEG